MRKMSQEQLSHLHEIAIRYQEKSEGTPSLDRHAYAAMSTAASNLILIELAMRQLEKMSERET